MKILFTVFNREFYVYPVTKAAFNGGDCSPLEEIRPHPVMVIFVPSNVGLRSENSTLKIIHMCNSFTPFVLLMLKCYNIFTTFKKC